MSADIDYDARAKEVLGRSRWWQVVAAAVMMGLISPYQYVWSSIEGPLAADLGVPLSALGIVFTLFVTIQSLSQFPVGIWRDSHGPRTVSLVAGVLAGGGYFGLAYATAIWQVYVLYALGAFGVGIVYTVAVNTALKWFPDRRGLTTGIGTMAFAAGSAVFIPYVRANTDVGAYSEVLRNMGLLIGIGVLVGAVALRDPPENWLADTDTADGSGDDTTDADDSRPTTDGGTAHTARHQYTPREMLRTWQFWVLFVTFTFVNAAGLLVTARVVSFAQNFGLAAAVATTSATVLALVGGLSRIVVGGVSDRVSRKWAIVVMSLISGLGLFSMVWLGRLGSGVGFIAAVVVTTFFWSPQFTLYPSLVGDYYGEANSSSNYALVYMGKVGGGVLGGAVAGWLIAVAGWTPTFVAGGILAIVAGVLSIALKPPKYDSPA